MIKRGHQRARVIRIAKERSRRCALLETLDCHVPPTWSARKRLCWPSSGRTARSQILDSVDAARSVSFVARMATSRARRLTRDGAILRGEDNQVLGTVTDRTEVMDASWSMLLVVLSLLEFIASRHRGRGGQPPHSLLPPQSPSEVPAAASAPQTAERRRRAATADASGLLAFSRRAPDGAGRRGMLCW